MFVPSACPCSLLCLSLCLSLCPSLCPFLCLSFAFAFRERVDFHWCGVVPVRYTRLSVRLKHRFPLTSESIVPPTASSRSVQRASAILDLVRCVPVLLPLSCPEACLASVPHTVAQVVPTPPRPDLCLPWTETATTASASLGTVLCVPAPTLPGNVSRFRIHSLDRSVSWSSGVLDLSCASSTWAQAFSLVSSEARSSRPRASLATDSLPHSRVQMEFFIYRRDVLSHLEWPTFPLMRFTRKRLRLDSNCEINQVSSGVLGNWGNWSSCCSVRIDRRLLSHQLILLMFDHCALLTHLRVQLLQPLCKFFHPDSSDVPKHVPQSQQQAPRACADVRLNGTFSWALIEPLKMGGSSHSLKITAGRRCTCLSS